MEEEKDPADEQIEAEEKEELEAEEKGEETEAEVDATADVPPAESEEL